MNDRSFIAGHPIGEFVASSWADAVEVVEVVQLEKLDKGVYEIW